MCFLFTGLIFASWGSRIPAIKEQLSMSEGQLAIAFMGLNAEAIVGLQLGGIIVPHSGSRRALFIAIPVFAGALLAPGFAPSAGVLVATLPVLRGQQRGGRCDERSRRRGRSGRTEDPLYPGSRYAQPRWHRRRGAGAAAARVSTLAYLGSFAGPALIGVLASSFGRARALALPALLVAITAAGAEAVRPAGRVGRAGSS
jgi:MFS family permease